MLMVFLRNAREDIFAERYCFFFVGEIRVKFLGTRKMEIIDKDRPSGDSDSW